MAARSADPQATRAAILGAARVQFGRHGFERTTIRAVAAAAEVDPALVMHYFRNKDGLFAAASELDVEIPDLTSVPPERVASVLLPLFAKAWSPEGALLPLLRAAATNRAAADALAGMFTRLVAPALGTVAVDRPDERAALIGAHLVGVAVGRHIIGLPPLVAMDDDTLAEWLGPVFAHYLTSRAPTGAV
ncbi:TetR/AcrR family transcriptional regulator [Cryptosporangium phraense]|uniref:TetR/AcrR family transcriptional regulator n=1 Tax=Cryptosporangium phraense TaxID=2593070 RepID=UPI00197AA077|nr:TetR/AcrR family transcriptional regulator [Cryptosporangium phraense]